MEYQVTWIIDINAGSFKEAARRALAIQRNPSSLATHFIVTHKDGDVREVWAENPPG